MVLRGLGPLPQQVQHRVGRAAPQAAARHLAVFNMDHRVLQIFHRQVVNHHLAGGAELRGQTVGHLLEQGEARFIQHGQGSFPGMRVSFLHHSTGAGESKQKIKKF